MADKKQKNVITDTNEPVEEVSSEVVVEAVEEVAEINDVVDDKAQNNEEVKDPNVVVEPVVAEKPVEIIDGKDAPLTKLEALVMFLAMVAVVFTCCFYAMFNINTKLDNLLDYSKLINQRVTYLETKVDELQVQAEQSVFDKSAFLGVTYVETEEDGLFLGVKIESVLEASPAEQAGIKAGDYIVAVDGEKIDSFAKLGNIITAHNAGDVLHITIATVENGQIINKNVHAELTYRGNYDIPSEPKE